MRGYTNATGGATLANIEFDREAFLQYLADLGSINENVEQIRQFVDSLAYNFSSGTISADKFITRGNNLIPNLDSFERQLNQSIPISPQNGISNLVVFDEEAPHGEAVLRLETAIPYTPSAVYLHPYSETSEPWITLGKFNYFISYYLKTDSPVSITGYIGLSNQSRSIFIESDFSIDSNSGWTRFSKSFELLEDEDLRLELEIDQAGAIVYLDAIQIEYKYANTLVPTQFAPGGKVIIEGGSIRANSIRAEMGIFDTSTAFDATTINLMADAIIAGSIDTTDVNILGPDGYLNLYRNYLEIAQDDPQDPEAPKLQRVILGDVNKDGSIYGLRIRGEDGTTILLDENGVYEEGITDGAITNNKIRSAIIELDEQGNVISAEGGIEGTKMAVNSIAAHNIVSQTIDTRHLKADIIDATHIKTNSLDADLLTNRLLFTKKILLTNDGLEQTVTAGISGGTPEYVGEPNTDIRFWAGATEPNKGSAPFYVRNNGFLYATNAQIQGNITATSGTFNGIVNAQGGEFSGTVTVGTAANKITIAASASPTTTAISGASTGFETGGFWMDASGRLSLGNISTAGLSWNGSALSIKGDITGSTGTFSGTVSASNLSGGSISLSALSGNAITSTNFTVTSTGTMTARSGSIGGWSIGNNTITSSNGLVKLDSLTGQLYLNSNAYFDAFSGESSTIRASGNIYTTGYISTLVNGFKTVYSGDSITSTYNDQPTPLLLNGSIIVTQNTATNINSRGPVKMWVVDNTLYIDTRI